MHSSCFLEQAESWFNGVVVVVGDGERVRSTMEGRFMFLAGWNCGTSKVVLPAQYVG
jgi:hypothetical protein